MARAIFRLLGLVIFGFLGWQVAAGLSVSYTQIASGIWIASGIGIGALLGALAIPYLLEGAFRFALRRVKSIPISVIVAGTLGLVVGLAVASLLAPPLSVLPGVAGSVLPIVVSLVLGTLGVAILVARERDLLQFVQGFMPESSRAGETLRRRLHNGQIILDTSAIIDGRIADVSQTGFIEGTFVIPRFILNELQHIADSSDPLRRNRGRRGLEILNKLRKESDIPIQVADAQVDEIFEVDGKLVKLAKELHASIVTTDFNLNRVAEIQGIRVLNVNELANALKPVFLPGEELEVKIIQEGKEPGQGVAFLDDGTMVVVEAGRRLIGSQVSIQVTRVLQTAAGRIVFAQTKS